MYSPKEAERVINEIKHFEKDIKPVVKAKILELARIYEAAIDEKNQIGMTKIKNVKGRDKDEEPNIKDIASLLNKLREENFNMISKGWLYKILPEKYKHDYKKDDIRIDEISDKELYMHKDDLIRRIKDMERGPSQDIKIKETKEDIDKYNFECFIAGELAKLAVKMEKDHKHKHDPKLCTKISKHVKSARDSRYATAMQEYEALIVACNSTTSLAHVVEGEYGFKTRWEIEEDEHNCRNCLDKIECAATKCKCPCHDVVKKMTTKGLKFAINSNTIIKFLSI